MAKKGNSVRAAAQKPPQQAACRGEVEGKSGGCGEGVEDAYMPVPQVDGIHEQAHDDAQPEEPVGDMPQPAERDTLPQNAEHIVQHSNRHAQRCCAAQQKDLFRYADAHVSRKAAPVDRLRGPRRRPRREGSPRCPLPAARRRPD